MIRSRDIISEVLIISLIGSLLVCSQPLLNGVDRPGVTRPAWLLIAQSPRVFAVAGKLSKIESVGVLHNRYPEGMIHFSYQLKVNKSAPLDLKSELPASMSVYGIGSLVEGKPFPFIWLDNADVDYLLVDVDTDSHGREFYFVRKRISPEVYKKAVEVVNDKDEDLAVYRLRNNVIVPR